MLKEIKYNLSKLKGNKIKIYVDVGRNKNEEYEGIIENLYENVWTFKTEYGIKSFGYYDILIKQVILLV